ncbi:MAG: murein biosynthesis integral membrane protein MurJ [SAR324 cluster bacterium]|uniref:Probable lipid II flippase MurJ n=1 Tax=SAR324 cluster bacterium TaxID=2024889 RepID=A0A2A4SUC0_9DELT|nr:MAG: murein biosynthesis integral membrane protein MurJ [SAR324 cluster bacterium]
MSQSPTKEKRSFAKSVGIISLITMLSRVMGLLREVVRASLLGTSFYSDAFTLAFALPNLFRRLTAEGVMSTAFIPIFCEVQKKEGEQRAFDFSRNFFFLLSLVLSCFALLFILLAPWLVKYIFAAGFQGEALEVTVFLTQLMFGYIIFISLAAICQGMLNSFSVFWISSLTPVLLNISMIGCALIFAPLLDNPALGFAIGVLLGGCLQLFAQFPSLRKIGFVWWRPLNFKDPKIKEVARLMVPAIFGAGIYQINIVIGNLIATTLEEGSLSSLNFSNRLLELVIGIFVVSLATVILPRLSHLFIDQQYQQVEQQLKNVIPLIAFITLPVIVITIILSEEIVTFLFLRGNFDQRSVLMTAGALKFHILGLVFISWNRILLTSYQAAKNFRRTVHISAIIMLINLGFAWGLSRSMGHLGIALANTISQIAQTLLLLYFLKEMKLFKVMKVYLEPAMIKNLLLALLLWPLLFYSKQWLLSLGMSVWVNLPLLGLFSLLLVFLLASLLRCRELSEMKGLIRKKRA